MLHVLVEAKKIVPKWVRIMRVQREITPNEIHGGPKSGNLRQIVQKRLQEEGFSCKCIRCREIGLKQLKEKLEIQQYDIEIKNTRYESSEGEEYFISAEEKNSKSLIGFVRMRIPSDKAHRKEIVENTAIIRDCLLYTSPSPRD